MGGERRPKNRVSLRRTLFWPTLGSKLSKYGNPRKTNSLKSGNFGTFSLNKNPCWYESHLIFFLSPSGHNSPPKEKRKMVGLLWIYLINYNVFVKLEKNGAIILWNDFLTWSMKLGGGHTWMLFHCTSIIINC